MPDLSAYIAFNVEFNLTGSPKLVLTDPNNYPAGVAQGITGIFSIKQPDCITENGNWNTPDIVWISGMLEPANRPLRPSTNRNYQEGNYTITYTVNCAGYTPTTITKQFCFQFCPPKLRLQQNFDVFTPDLNITDATVYTVPNYNISSSSNSWSAQIGNIGTLNAANTNVFNLRINSNYYDATYAIAFSKTALYQSNIYPWLSVLYQFGQSINTSANTPPQMDVLVGYLTALKTVLDASQQCDPCKCDEGLKCTYLYAEAILAHTQMRLCSGDLAVEDYVNQFIKLTHNNQTPKYVNTNTVITPYVLTFCQSGPGTGGTAHISITNADFEADGVTYKNVLLVPDNVSVFWSDLPNYIYQDAGQWQYVSGGIKILIPGFNANENSYHIELDIKQLS